MIGKPIEPTVRALVLRAVDAGKLPRPEIAQLFGVSERWLRKALRQRRYPRHRSPSTHFKLTDPEPLRLLVAEQPEATLAKLSALLKERHGIEMHGSSIWRQMRKLGLLVQRKQKRRARKCPVVERVSGAGTFRQDEPSHQVQPFAG